MPFHRNARLVLACAVSALGLATGAGAASAAPATFSAVGNGALASSGSLVFKAGTTPNAARTFTCAAANINWQTPTVNTSSLSGIPFAGSTCSNGLGQFAFVTMSSAPGFVANNNAGVFSLSSNATMYFSINGVSGLIVSNPSQPTAYTAAWANGTSSADPSVLTFNNAAIGVASNTDSGIKGQSITLTGSIKVSRQGGSLLTLS